MNKGFLRWWFNHTEYLMMKREENEVCKGEKEGCVRTSLNCVLHLDAESCVRKAA